MSASKKISKKGMPLNKGSTGPVKPEDNRILLVADWLRNEKRSGLKTKEAVQYEKRVEYFKGAKLVDCLLGPKFKGPAAAQNTVKSRAEAAKLGQELLRLGYIHRSQRVTHAHTRRWELELVSGPFEEEGLYTWVYEGSKTKLYLLCGGMLLGSLALCMIQIWPLWLKIAVWWCSVVFLVTFGVLVVVRLILFCLMWIIGFRGIWLFPNLFDDNQTFAGSFVPIFGKGDPVFLDEDSDEEYWEHVRKKAKSKSKQDSDNGKEPLEGVSKSGKDKDKPVPSSWQFGWVNIVIIFGIGAIACIKMGMFDGDNVPDFVAKRDDLQYYFKSLAAPEVNETEEDDGLPKRDPFAAPEDEEPTRF